jgi:DNA-binding transcriptional LysR family regulator
VELRELRAFVVSIEEGSLSAAARRLNITQPALSQTIQGLERQLGVTLLTRSSTGIRTTHSGDMLLVEARAILGRHDEAVARVSTSAEANHGALRIGLPAEFPPGALSDALAELSVTHNTSGIQLRHMSTSEQLTALLTDDLDAGLVRELPVGQELAVALVVEEKLGVLLSTANATRLTDTAEIRLDQLAGLAWVGFPRPRSPAWYDEVTAILRGHGLAPAAEYEQSPTAELKLAAASIGDAFALLPQWSRGTSGSVTWLPLTGHPLVRRTWVAWPARSQRRDLACLVDCLRRHAYQEGLP